MKKDICCVFLCKEKIGIAAYNINHLQKMVNDSKCSVDLFIYDNIDIKEYMNEFNYYHIFDKKTFALGNIFLVLFDCYMKHKDEYSYYMFFEEDLVFNSDKNLFDDIYDNFLKDGKYDIIFQNKRKLDYYWYWSQNHLNNIKYKGYKPYAGLLNIYLMNDNVIQDLISFINEGNWAHYEYIVNSYVMTTNKYSIGYLTDIYNTYFTYERMYKGEHALYDYELIHPIKTLEEFVKYL